MIENISASIVAPVGPRRLSAGWEAGPKANGPQIAFAGDLLRGQRFRIGLPEHVSNFGRLPGGITPQVVLETLRAANLTGRGGAGFAFAKKMDAVARTQSRKGAIVVANASESEPLSKKDTLLLRNNPHLVLDGITISATALGAKAAYIYIKDKEAQVAVGAAIRERRDRGVEEVKVTVVEAPSGYVSGQETSVVRRIERGPALPRYSTARVAVSGVKGAPTLLANVETYAHVALIMRFGADWYRRIGTGADPGTRLVTVVGAVERPGVYEVAPGFQLSSLLRDAGGSQVRAVLLGGYFGGWISAPSGTELDFAIDDVTLSERKLSMGAGVIGVLNRDTCPVVEAAGIVEYLAGQSAGQCGPCVNGLPEISTSFARIALSSNVDRGLTELRSVIPLVERRGGCQHPDGVIGLVRSTVGTFADEIRLHKQGRCSALGSHRSVLLPASAPSSSMATAVGR